MAVIVAKLGIRGGFKIQVGSRGFILGFRDPRRFNEVPWGLQNGNKRGQSGGTWDPQGPLFYILEHLFDILSPSTISLEERILGFKILKITDLVQLSYFIQGN